MQEKKEARPTRISRAEMRKRPILESVTSPGGIDTSLSRIGQPVGPLGEHLAEDERRAGGTRKPSPGSARRTRGRASWRFAGLAGREDEPAGGLEWQ